MVQVLVQVPKKWFRFCFRYRKIVQVWFQVPKKRFRSRKSGSGVVQVPQKWFRSRKSGLSLVLVFQKWFEFGSRLWKVVQVLVQVPKSCSGLVSGPEKVVRAP